MKKVLRYAVLFSLIMVYMTGCTGEASSYASILIYNNQQFIGKDSVPTHQYTSVERIGTVIQEVDSDQLPQNHLSSNELAKGTEIYITKDNKLLAKVNDEQYKVFELKQ